MEAWLTILLTVVGSVLASSGFWAFLQSRGTREDAETQLLRGLAHDRIVHLGMTYIERGSLSKDEFEDFVKYLYEPYKELGGNGLAEKVYNEVSRLPIRKSNFIVASTEKEKTND